MCNVNLSCQVFPKDQERGNSTATTQSDTVKVKEHPLDMSGGSCSKGTWRRFFVATGKIIYIQIIWIKCKTFEAALFQLDLFRNLGPANYCPCRSGGLCSPRCRLLQHGRITMKQTVDGTQVKPKCDKLFNKCLSLITLHTKYVYIIKHRKNCKWCHTLTVSH